jgi:hypothetical protein
LLPKRHELEVRASRERRGIEVTHKAGPKKRNTHFVGFIEIDDFKIPTDKCEFPLLLLKPFRVFTEIL